MEEEVVERVLFCDREDSIYIFVDGAIWGRLVMEERVSMCWSRFF